jgi:hypothetical protein
MAATVLGSATLTSEQRLAIVLWLDRRTVSKATCDADAGNYLAMNPEALPMPLDVFRYLQAAGVWPHE